MAEPNDRVAFTRRAAQRITDVVKVVEAGNRDAAALTFSKLNNVAPQATTFKLIAFTGTWARGGTRDIQIGEAPTNTASIVNLFFPLDQPSSLSRDGAIAKIKGQWYLVAVPFRTATVAVVVSQYTQAVVTDVQFGAVLNTSNCTITVGKTQVTAGVAVVSMTSTVAVQFLT